MGINEWASEDSGKIVMILGIQVLLIGPACLFGLFTWWVFVGSTKLHQSFNHHPFISKFPSLKSLLCALDLNTEGHVVHLYIQAEFSDDTVCILFLTGCRTG